MADCQLTGMAGEFLTVGKLFKYGYQASVTLGNAKAVDVLVYNPATDKSFTVQVKTLRKKNCFPLRRQSINPSHIYVFVILNDRNQPEDFFIVPGQDILDDVNRFFGSSYRDPKKVSRMPAINYGPLARYRNKWEVFDRT